MKRIQHGLGKGLTALGALSALSLGAAGCSEAEAKTPVAVSEQQLSVDDIIKECGLVCPGGTDADGIKVKGVAEGNAAIAGVASIDGFFASVVGFNAAAHGTAAGIQAQLDGIRADFGIAANADLAAELKGKFDANLKAGYKIHAEPARCQADVQASLQAQAKCDASIDPGKATVKCEGRCEAKAGAELNCGAEVEVQCTATGPSIACSGSCKGSCKLEAAATCEGTCKGSCSGTCEVKDTQGNCNGACDGECSGSCELTAAASCSGSCDGECTAKAPEAGCDASARASCSGSASVKAECSGSCDGDFEPPMAKAECQASAKADAKVNVQCTPPSVKIDFELAAVAAADVSAQVQFTAALKSFADVRLPALLASLKKADVVVDAGGELVSAAEVAVKGAVDTALGAKGDFSVRAAFGLNCALAELPKAVSSINDSTGDLEASISVAGKLTGALL